MANIFRFRCNQCTNVFDVPGETQVCPHCGAALIKQNTGIIQVYRMGSPIGVAVGYGIYIDGVPYGHLANTQSIRISVPLGTHLIHMTCGMTRRCKDLQVTVTPENPYAYVKARMKAGFWSNTIEILPSNAQEMPQVY